MKTNRNNKYLSSKFIREVALALTTVVLSGCAILIYEESTGTQHVYGIGHLRMRSDIKNEHVGVVATGVQTLGLSLGTVPEGGAVSLGWQNITSVKAITHDSGVIIEWPRSDLFELGFNPTLTGK